MFDYLYPLVAIVLLAIAMRWAIISASKEIKKNGTKQDQDEDQE